MTVEELIKELERYPKDARIEVGSVWETLGVAVHVLYYDKENTVEIEY